MWVEPFYRTICERVWIEPVYRTECERVWVPDRFEIRETPEGYGRNARIVRREVLVEAGHYATVERQVIAQYGRWENVERQELVSPGHYEFRTDRIAVNDRPGNVFDIFFSRR